MGSRDKNSDGNIETPPEALAPGAPEKTSLPPIAQKADDLEEIKKAVEDAASVSGGLWLSYLFVLSYVAIAAGAVTHEDLLLIRPVKLPFLIAKLWRVLWVRLFTKAKCLRTLQKIYERR